MENEEFLNDPTLVHPDLSRIAKNIKEARIAKGMTQMELSTAVGKSYNAACLWETGIKKFTAEIAEKVAKVLELPLDLFESPEVLVEGKKNKGSRIMREVIDRAKELRVQHRYSMREMAKVLGIIPSHYFRIEGYQSNFTLAQIIELSNRFKVTTDYLLKGELSPTESFEELQGRIKHLEWENELMKVVVNKQMKG